MTQPDIQSKASQLMELCWRRVEEVLARPSGIPIETPNMIPADPNQVSGANFDGPFPALDYLDGSLELAKAAGFEDIVSGIESLRDSLRWSQNASYRPGTVPQELLDGYTYAGLAGPGGLIPCEAPLCGFMLMAPGVYYPDHQHEPPEIYLVLTPGTEWKLDQKEWFDVQAGDLIHHQPWQWHATRTVRQPMLAFAGWLEPGQRAAITMDHNN